MQSALPFPQPFTERYRPQRIGEFVGLAEAKRDCAAIVSRPIPNAAYLFCGESGTGKTTMALAIARELNAQVHHVPARQADKATIERIWEAVHYTTWSASNQHVVMIDEVDLWRVDLQDMMLSIWDSMGSLANTLFSDWTPTPPQVIWLCTTNCDHRKLKSDSRFEPRFVSRLRVIPFSNYGMAPAIAAFLERVWTGEGQNGNPPDFLRMAKEARNNIRECLNQLETLIARNGVRGQISAPQIV